MNKFAIKKSLKPKKEFAKKEVYGIFQFFFFLTLIIDLVMMLIFLTWKLLYACMRVLYASRK